MSLLRLLSVGRSLGRVSDPPSRYRMTQQSLLPKFGGAKKTAEGEPADGENREPKSGSLSEKFLTAARSLFAAKQDGQMNRIEADGAAATVKPQAYPRGRWTLFRNPFSTPTKPASGKECPVQGELSLEAVRPVRNDLSDSDGVVQPPRASTVVPTVVSDLALAEAKDADASVAMHSPAETQAPIEAGKT